MAQIPQDVGRPQDPDYTRLSHPIPQPRPNTTAGTFLEGAGKAIEVGAKGLDFLIKDTIEQGLRPKLEALKEEEINTLETTKQALLGGKPTNLIPPSGVSEDGSTAGIPPEDLEQLSSKLLRLKGANRAGIVSHDEYVARIAKEVKPFRDLYRGHVDYIDHLTSSITGIPMANARIRALSTDINRLLAAQGASAGRAERTLEKIRDTGDENFRTIQTKFRRGEIDADGLNNYYNESQRGKWKTSVLQDNLNNVKLTLETRSIYGSEWVKSSVGTDVTNAMTVLMAGGEGVPAEMVTIGKELEAGRYVPEQQKEEFGYFMNTYLSRFRQNQIRKATDAGVVQVKGMEQTVKEIDEAMAPLRIHAGLLGKGEYDAAGRVARQTKAANDDVWVAAMGDKTLKSYTLKETLAKRMNLPPETLKTLLNQEQQMVPLMKTFMEFDFLTAATQGTTPREPVQTLNKAMDQAKKLGFQDNVKENLINGHKFILDPKNPDSTKLGYIAYYFHPENRGFIERLNKEAQVPTFLNLASPEMAQEVFRIAKETNNREAIQYYDSWVRITQRNLMVEDFKNLNEVIQSPNLEIHFNDQTFKFKVIDKIPRTPGLSPGYETMRQQSVDRTDAIVKRVNDGLVPIVGLSKAYENRDTITEVQETLENAGVQFTNSKADLDLPEKMMQAVMAQRVKKAKEEQEKEAEKERQRAEHAKKFRQR